MKKLLLIISLFFVSGSFFANETETHREEFVAALNGPRDLQCQNFFNSTDAVNNNMVKLSLSITNAGFPSDITIHDYYTFIDYGFEPPINCARFSSLLSDTNIQANVVHTTVECDNFNDTHTIQKVLITLPNYPGISFFNKG